MKKISDKRQRQLEELEVIRGETGGLVPPQAIVDFARDSNTALHDEFTWDDAKAAELRRLDEARRLIRVMVVVQNIGDKDRKIRAFVSIMEDRRVAGGGYRFTPEVMRDEERRAMMLQTALRELRAFKARFAELQELAAVFEAIEEIAIPAPVVAKESQEAMP